MEPRREPSSLSEDSSFLFVDSTKDSPKGESSTTKEKGAENAGPNTGKDPKGEDINLQTLKMFLESQQKTLEIVLGSAAKGKQWNVRGRQVGSRRPKDQSD